MTRRYKKYVSDDEIVAEMLKWIEGADADEISRLAEEMFGGRFSYNIESDMYEVEPNELYWGAFDDYDNENDVDEEGEDFE